MALATPDAVVMELMTMGQQSAVHLGHLLRSSSPASQHQDLAAEILRCCSRVIAALTANAGKKRKAIDHDSPAAAAAARSPPSTPPRKRVRVGEEALGVVTSGTTVDGFIWRKYGQKEINGRKHPKLYYRCAYKDQGCPATRRVQPTHDDDEPVAYEIAYYGHHSCRGAATCQDAAAAAPPTVIDFGSNVWGCGTAPTTVVSEQLWPWNADMSSSQSGWSPVSSSSEVGFVEAQTTHDWHGTVCGAAPAAASDQLWSWNGDLSQTGWSPASASSEVGFEAQTASHEWHGTVQVEVPSPCVASDPVMEFLDGCFDWESVINDVPFDFPALFPSH